MCGQPMHNTRPHARLQSIFWGMDASEDLRMNVAFIHKIRWSLVYVAYLFDMLPTSFGTTRHWQTSGRLVQELNVCAVCVSHVLITPAFRVEVFPDSRVVLGTGNHFDPNIVPEYIDTLSVHKENTWEIFHYFSCWANRESVTSDQTVFSKHLVHQLNR